MKHCSKHIRITTGDVLLLTLLMLAWMFGAVAAFWSLPIVYKVVSMLLFETVLFGWIAGWSESRDERMSNFCATLKLQGQAAAQILPGMYFIGLCGLLVMQWRGGSTHSLPWERYMHIEYLWHFHSMGLSLALLAAQLIGAARVHTLHRKGLRLGDVIAGALNKTEKVIAAPEATVRERLDYYLEQLTKPGAPTMARLWYGRKPLVDTIDDKGRPVYRLKWRDGPSHIELATDTVDAGTSRVVLRCVLSGGQHRLDLFVNPIDALALMEFVRANVLQLLSSELALSASVQRQDALRLQAVEMQLRILQAQIEPHFLFNTLANVRQLYRTSVESGEDMMDHLIMYLRCSMHELRSDKSTVAQEFDMVLHYLAIMKIRMGERLSYRFVQGDALAQHAFPPAMLMSLVENAIMHGLRDKADGMLTISAAAEDGQLRVTVLDNGPGFSSVQGSGSGLSNIRQRLEALYGKLAWLEVGAVPDGGFMASILIPLAKPEVQ